MNPLKSRSLPQPNGCINWGGTKTHKGYGKLNYKGKRWYAHRLSYTLTYGTIPPLLQVCHSCDNPGCVNPRHLFLGTNQDNVDDKIQKKRMPKGQTHYKTKFKPDILEKIAKDPRTQMEIALEYQTSQPHISRIKKAYRNES